MSHEVNVRWNLAERGWELGVNRSLLTVGFDTDTKGFLTLNSRVRHRAVMMAHSSFRLSLRYLLLGNLRGA